MEYGKASDLVKLLLEHRDGLFGFVFALTHDREAAEEIFQEVGLAVVEEAGKKTAVARFLPWAHELARRRVSEYFRKKARRRALEHSEPLDEVLAQAFQENAADPAALNHRQEHLEECLEDLPPTQRRLIEQRYNDHSPIQSIADSVSWTVGSVKVALWKARRQLARCIEGKMAAGGAD